MILVETAAKLACIAFGGTDGMFNLASFQTAYPKVLGTDDPLTSDHARALLAQSEIFPDKPGSAHFKYPKFYSKYLNQDNKVDFLGRTVYVTEDKTRKCLTNCGEDFYYIINGYIYELVCMYTPTGYYANLSRRRPHPLYRVDICVWDAPDAATAMRQLEEEFKQQGN